MQLYKTYLGLWKEGHVNAGFSPRLPDYAIRFWLDNLEVALGHATIRSFLDIGAGDGRLSLLLLRATCARGTAVEVQPSQSAWNPIVEQYPDFQLHEGLLQEFVAAQGGGKQFDFILLAEVFEHIPPGDVAPFLTALRSLLADGGTVFITTPNRTVLGPAEQTHMWHERQPYGHHKHYTYQELADIVAPFGFTMTWFGFECHRLKSKLYNRWFYPASRLDARLLFSRKIPSALRAFYRVVTWSGVALVRGWFWLLARGVYAVERRYSNEQTAETIMLVLRKK